MNARHLIALLGVIALLIAGGCGGEGGAETETATAPSATETATPQVTEPESHAAQQEEPAAEETAPPPEANISESEPEPPPPPPAVEAPAEVEEGGPAEMPAEEPAIAYADLLQRIVTDAGLVRYDVLADPPLKAALDAAATQYAEAVLPEDEKARLALWCNAYNANVLSMALTESRKEGFINVLEVPGFFDGRTITVAGEMLTLNELENDHIRPLNDPRIHAALVCAAMSCPPLRAEPYVADRLDEQLDDQCRRWVNDPSKFRMVDGKLGLSEILKWYGEDFHVTPYGSDIGFVLAYARPTSRMTGYIISTDRPQVTWIPYDWSLNQAPPPPPGETGGRGEQGEEQDAG